MSRHKIYADAAARKAAKLEAQRLRRSMKPIEAETRIEAASVKPIEVSMKPIEALAPVRHQPHVPLSLFDSVRRGTPRTHTDGYSYVLIARGAPSLVDGRVYDSDAYAVVTAADWHARIDQRCTHGYAGWTCHAC